MQRLGFFGGCFNPPTIAHYELALKALESAKLDKVFFVPMGDYYHKKGLLPAKERLQMLKVMVEKNPRLDVSSIQMDQKTELYAIDTFQLIEERYKNSDNFFIMGSDNFEKIHKWKEGEKLLNSYHYIVFNRGSFHDENVIVVETNNDLRKVSSSLVRSKILNKENIEKLVTKEVEKYILEKKLYQESA